MSKTTSSSGGGGIGFFGLLGILFIALKLLGYIDWAWWLVLAPIWIPAAILAFLLVIVGILYVITKD